MALLTRDAILAAQDLETREVDVPEWGGAVRVRGLTAAERDAFEASLLIVHGTEREISPDNFRAKLVARACVDEHGQRLFTDGDVAALGQKSAAALQRVFDVARELSRLTKEDVDALGKDSAPILVDGSASA